MSQLTFDFHKTKQPSEPVPDPRMLAMSCKDARAEIRGALLDGITSLCPCCDQTVALRRRSITSAMALWLISLVKRSVEVPDGWVHTREILLPDGKLMAGGDYAKLRYWALVESQRTDTPGASGHWRPTPKGVQFAYDRCRIPTNAWVYNRRCYGMSSEMISIRTALSKRTNYEEVMRNAAPFDALLSPWR